jgi:NAD-dependent deacetylase
MSDAHQPQTEHSAEYKKEQIQQAAKMLSNCRRLLVLTGAGLSADAGVPTFRGAGGLWNEYKAEDLASLEGFAANPDLVWDWYRERRMAVAEAKPHAGQRSLALLQQHFSGGQVLMVTTNEDDLLERVGVTDVVHMHGSLFATKCADLCGWDVTDSLDNAWSMVACPKCGARTRPGSVWYGEKLPEEPLQRIAQFEADGCLLIGSSLLVQPMAQMPGEISLHGHPVVEINTEETPFSQFAMESLRGTAKDILPSLVDLLTSHIVRAQIKRAQSDSSQTKIPRTEQGG